MPATSIPMPATIGAVSPAVVANPGANTDFSYNGAELERFRLVAIRYTFTADSTVADRIPGLIISFSGVEYEFLGTDVFTANQVVNIQWLADGPPKDFTSPPDDYYYYRLPFIEFDSTMVIGSNCVNMQAGDTFTDIRLIRVLWQDQEA